MNLVTVIPVLYRGKQFNVGETLPTDDEDMNTAWLEAGSAKWIGKEAENKQDSDHEKAEKPVKKKTSKAKQAAALEGNTGEAVNSTAEINQVGRIPEAEERKK